MHQTKTQIFSDTLVLDTVYNQVRSRNLCCKIYNDENKDISIQKIYLESGNSSLYRINVDGKAGTEFTNVPLRKRQPLYFCRNCSYCQCSKAIAEKNSDRIASCESTCDFASVVQDVEFYISTENSPKILTDNTSWNNTKAKIIYGDLKIS